MGLNFGLGQIDTVRLAYFSPKCLRACPNQLGLRLAHRMCKTPKLALTPLIMHLSEKIDSHSLSLGCYVSSARV